MAPFCTFLAKPTVWEKKGEGKKKIVMEMTFPSLSPSHIFGKSFVKYHYFNFFFNVLVLTQF